MKGKLTNAKQQTLQFTQREASPVISELTSLPIGLTATGDNIGQMPPLSRLYYQTTRRNLITTIGKLNSDHSTRERTYFVPTFLEIL